jgi:hypothetical protein
MIKDYYKVLDVIDSCVTIPHLESATKMLVLWYEKHLDYEIYTKTFSNQIKNKFLELNGDDITKLPFKTVETWR